MQACSGPFQGAGQLSSLGAVAAATGRQLSLQALLLAGSRPHVALPFPTNQAHFGRPRLEHAADKVTQGWGVKEGLQST